MAAVKCFLRSTAADHANRLAEVGLGMPWRMHKRHETSPASAGRQPANVVLHNRDPTRKTRTRRAGRLEDPFGCMPLLSSADPLSVARIPSITPVKLVELRPERRLPCARTQAEPRISASSRPFLALIAEPIRRRTLADPPRSKPRAGPARKAPLSSSPAPCRLRQRTPRLPDADRRLLPNSSGLRRVTPASWGVAHQLGVAAGRKRACAQCSMQFSGGGVS